MAEIELTDDELYALLAALGYYYAAHQDRGWQWPHYHDDLTRARTKLEAAQ